MSFRLLAALMLVAVALAFGLSNQDANAADDTEVDLELVLAVDVSYSMSPFELEIQRRGYAEALISPQVIKAIQSGMLGRVAITYIEWAGTTSHRVIVGWSLIDGLESAQVFSDQLTARFSNSLRRTSISGALDMASRQFEGNGFVSNRQVIDVSGDGPNNMGRSVLEARDDALAKGIVINGLPLMTRDGMDSLFYLEDLDEYYRYCVIGGPAAFIIPVTEWSQFADAVRRKLVLELAGRQPLQPALLPANFTGKTENGYDCLIGERLWKQFRYQPPEN